MNTMLIKAFARNMKGLSTMQRAQRFNGPVNYHNSFLRVSSRTFSKQPEQETKEQIKKEQKVDEEEPEKFVHDEKKDKKQDQSDEEDEDQKAQFKTYRRIMYFIGKAIKYSCWGAISLFMYHWALIKKYDKPETMPTSEPFLEAARFVDWSIYDFKVLMTKPGMTKMLPDRLNMPGQMEAKVLVMNLNGTLVHSTYSMGVGVEIYKRPGLTMFLNRMSRQYELCIFGLGEQGGIEETCEALDPQGQMIFGRFGRESTVLKGGKYIKDLSYMNRPLKDIIYLDFTDDPVEMHRENAIIIPKFEGDTSDRNLHDLIPFLDHLAKYPGDVRKEISRYGSETCSQKFNEQQQYKMQFIQNQRQSGIGGFMGGRKPGFGGQ